MHVNRTDQGEPITETSWPKNKVPSIDCRKRDTIIRIADWTRDDDDKPAYDVEVYEHGIYDWNESQSFSTRNADRTKAEARKAAVEFAIKQIRRLLK